MSGLSREGREEERGFPFWRSWLGKEKRKRESSEKEKKEGEKTKRN